MKSLFALLAASSALTLSGCFVGIDDDAVFTVEWRIDGSDHPAACADFRVDAAYVEIHSRSGLDDYRTVRCEDFGTDFDLPPGTYWATVSLVDRSGFDVTTVIETDEYRLTAGGGNYVVADFPPSSFD
jgi:hypothetical protein